MPSQRPFPCPLHRPCARLNRIINCAQKLHPSQRQWLPFVVCLEARPTLIVHLGTRLRTRLRAAARQPAYVRMRRRRGGMPVPDSAAAFAPTAPQKSAGLAQPEAEVGACAREAGLDPIKLHTCASGPLGTQLEREAGAATAALRPPHT